jgi:hypothetical protein
MQSNDFTKSSIATAIIIISFVIFWEFFWRNQGYLISYNEDKVMWAATRKKVYLPSDQATVFVGDSRVKFDIDIPTWKALTGEEAIQLALVGTPPRPVLQDLAHDEHFRGKVVFGASEAALYTLDSTRRERSAKEGIEYFKSETPAQKLNASLDFLLESDFVFLEEGKFGLNALLNTIPLKNRPGVVVAPGPPKGFSMSTLARQSSITPMFFRDSSIRNATIRYWAGGATRNRLRPLKGDTLEILLKQLKYFIDKIKSRGGQVFIIRPPSGGSVLERENKLWPREQYWNRLLEYIQIPGLYYTDYPELAGMVCPEESHLTPADAIIFTRTLVNVLQKKGGWTFHGPPDSVANRLKQ